MLFASCQVTHDFDLSITDDVYFSHLIKVVSARLPYCQSSLPLCNEQAVCREVL